jgi:hypothetical protein
LKQTFNDLEKKFSEFGGFQSLLRSFIIIFLNGFSDCLVVGEILKIFKLAVAKPYAALEALSLQIVNFYLLSNYWNYRKIWSLTSLFCKKVALDLILTSPYYQWILPILNFPFNYRYEIQRQQICAGTKIESRYMRQKIVTLHFY